MNEALEKVEHDLGFASDGLREALHKASAVEALVLLPLIKQVNEARNEVAALFAARMSDTANAPLERSARSDDTLRGNVRSSESAKGE